MMDIRGYKRAMGGRVERAMLRVMLAVGLAMAVGVWYLTREAGDGLSLWLPGVVGLATVGGVRWFGRARARGRWEAAWDAYASDEFEIGAFGPVEQSAELCLSVGR